MERMESMQSIDILSLSSQLIHPILMLGLFIYIFYIAYLGFQVRRTRIAEREIKKELIKGNYNRRHHQTGSILLAVMVIGAVSGIVITYLSAGELPINTHLFVGLSMTALIAMSSALAPTMQEGRIWARYAHAAINITLLVFFGWQSITGLQIVQDILTGA